jgi:hypothetical protein
MEIIKGLKEGGLVLVSVLIIIIFMAFAYFFGDWKAWKSYHTTILYVAVMNLTYEFLAYNHPLWQYRPGIIPNHTFTTLLTIFVVLPVITLIYLSHYPENLKWKVLYVTCWVIGSTLIEYSLTNRLIVYDNGWGIEWSFLLYCLMYLMLRLHHKKPVAAYFLSFIFIIFFLYYFKIPFNSMK